MSTSGRADDRRPYWIALGLLIALIAVMYRSSWMSLVHTWRVDTTFGHGFLILPMALYLMWGKRHDLAGIEFRPSWIGAILLAMSVGIWTLGTLVHVRLLEQIGFVGILQSLVPLVLGLGATRVLLFPLAFLWFSIPIGKELVPPLMEVTADLSVLFLRLSGVPVFRDEMLLYIPAGTYEVARACSGIKFLTAAVAIGTFYAYVMYDGLRKRVAFVVLAIVVAILSNGVRAYLLVLIGHLTDMRFEHDRWHIVLGYVVFGTILLLLLQIGARFRDFPAPVPATRSPRPVGSFNAAVAARAMIPVIISGGFLWGVPVYASTVVAAGGSRAMILSMSEPLRPADGWVARPLPPAWRPSISGGIARREGRYSGESGEVDVFVEVFPLPSVAGAEMISYRNSIQADSNERLYADRARIIDLRSERGGVTVRETVVSKTAPRLVWYWYDVAGRPAISGVQAKLLEASSLLRHGRGAQRIVVVSTEIEARSTADDRLKRFVGAHGAQLGVNGSAH